MKKNILFDLEGTLADTKELQVSMLKKVMEANSADVEAINFLALIGPPLIDTFAKYFGKDNAHEVYEQYVQIFHDTRIENIHLMNGVKEMLGELKERGYNLFTCSLQEQSVCAREVEALGILEYFTAVMGDDISAPFRSKSSVINKIISTYGLKPYETVMVGDTKFDVFSAQNSGLDVIRVKWGYGLDENIPLGTKSVKTPKELIRVIASGKI